MSLTAWGLLSDLVGIVALAVATPRIWGWHGAPETKTGEPDWKSRWRKWVYYGGWTLVAGGFALQLVAEVTP